MTRTLSRLISTTGSLALSVAPHGGQRTARRNALTAVLSDEMASRSRAEVLAEADAAIAATRARSIPQPALTAQMHRAG